MSRIFAFNMVTLDGFFEGPDHDISWHNVDRDFGAFALAQLTQIGTLLFGRATYEMMAGYWPTPAGLADDPAVAALMNEIPKVVVSRTLKEATWSNSRLVVDKVREQILALKQRSTKDLAVFGSANLLRTLIQANLIDEHRLMVNPLVLGKGTPLFPAGAGRLDLKLVRSQTFANGNVLLCYESAGQPDHSAV